MAAEAIPRSSTPPWTATRCGPRTWPPAPVTLPVVAEVAAGHPATRPLGRARRCASSPAPPLPDGAGAVVMVERTERLDSGKSVHRRGRRGRHPPEGGGRGSQAGRGRAVRRRRDHARPGRRAGPLGVAEVLAHPAPGGRHVHRRRAGVGTRALRPGQIRDSNRPTLLALAAEAGFIPIDLGWVPDDEDAIRDAIERGAADCDAVISAGACRWATSTWCGWCSTRSATCAGCRWRSAQPSRWPSAWCPARAPIARSRCSACPATRCRPWSASPCSPAPACG